MLILLSWGFSEDERTEDLVQNKLLLPFSVVMRQTLERGGHKTQRYQSGCNCLILWFLVSGREWLITTLSQYSSLHFSFLNGPENGLDLPLPDITGQKTTLVLGYKGTNGNYCVNIWKILTSEMIHLAYEKQTEKSRNGKSGLEDDFACNVTVIGV